MLSIILAVIIGIIFAVVATQNPLTVPLNVMGSAFTLPLYIIAALSFLAGIFISLLFHIADLMSAQGDLAKQERVIKDSERNNQILQKEVSYLKVQNAQLKKDFEQLRSKIRTDQLNRTKENVKNFFGKIRHAV